MTTTKKRVAALMLATMIAAAGAIATSATIAASDAHAVINDWTIGIEE